MDSEAATERRLEREAATELIARIDKGGIDCARVEVSYGPDVLEFGAKRDASTHCGYFIVGCHPVDEWDEEEAYEPYSPYASSDLLVREWFEARPEFCDWFQIDETYAC